MNTAVSSPISQDKLPQLRHSLLRMDSWLETMRGSDGYGGPVAHWWGNCFHFTGAGLDWRYEGIICGYLSLYESTHNQYWLKKAQRAGDDLVKGQLTVGNYRNSNFEVNPYPGGTPHEAACDVGLLALAQVLRQRNDPVWEDYAKAAERNLQTYLLGQLWKPHLRYFCDEAHSTLFVPNKAAMIVEALFGWFALTGDDTLLERYVRATLNGILKLQVRARGMRLDGAIDQSSYPTQRTGMYFPFYIARCIPALLYGYDWTGDIQYLHAAQAALAFILRVRLADGSFPQVIYQNGVTHLYPLWVAGTGDVLRAMELMRQRGAEVFLEPTLDWLLRGQSPSGAIRTAHGFSSQGTSHAPPTLPEFRDVLPVCGWIDKAFRYLCTFGAGVPPPQADEIVETDQDCLFQGRVMKYRESEALLELWESRRLVYRWRKGAPWAETIIPIG